MGYDLICMGTALVDSIIRGLQPTPVSASGYLAESGTLSAGGEAVNEAVAAAKLGLKTAICCALGRDLAGDLVMQVLERSGVDVRYVRRTGETPVSTLLVREDGTRRSITNLAHRVNFHPEQDLSVLDGAKVLMLGSLFRPPFDDPEVIRAVTEAAAEKGVRIFADTKLPSFRVLTLKDVRDSLRLMDMITPNEDEARFFSGRERPEEMADVFLDFGVRNVVIKLGGRGCMLKNAQGAVFLPALPVQAVDATGAGDNFAAGLVSELLRGADMAEALRFANACGALCTTMPGAGSALRNREQVLELMRTACSGITE